MPLALRRVYHLFTASFSTAAQPIRNKNIFNTSLDVDCEVSCLIRQELDRQRNSLILIPSENFASLAIMKALSTPMQNKYSEGYPDARYYGGNQVIDQMERLCQQRALEAFGLTSDWGVNVQPLSGSPANFAVYTALLRPHDRLLGLDLPHGGHLSHGYQTASKKISAVSTYFETMGYQVVPETGIIDYDQLDHLAKMFRPKLIIAGASAYPRLIDFKRMKGIADSVNAYLMADISHLSGMIAANIIPGPFDYADVVTTTTHKTLRGPRAAMIFYRNDQPPKHYKGGQNETIGDMIDQAVFPGLQGGPHNHSISALAVALKLARTDDFKDYQRRVIENCRVLADRLKENGIKLVANGTDTHLLLADLRSKGIDGARVEYLLDLANITANKNTIPGDVSALKPSGLRLGSPAMTSRGFRTSDFHWAADIVCKAIEIAKDLQTQLQTRSLVEFKKTVIPQSQPKLIDLREQVKSYVQSFPFYD